jgi:hypothetical protein
MQWVLVSVIKAAEIVRALCFGLYNNESVMKPMKPTLVIVFTWMLACGLGVLRADPTIIQEEAVKKWPDDTEKQAYFIKSETADWKAFNKQSATTQIPEKVLQQMKQCCETRHDKRFCMQWYMLKKEMKDYQSLQKLNSRGQKELRKEAAAKWPKSYSMQLYRVKKAMKATPEQATPELP